MGERLALCHPKQSSLPRFYDTSGAPYRDRLRVIVLQWSAVMSHKHLVNFGVSLPHLFFKSWGRSACAVSSCNIHVSVASTCPPVSLQYTLYFSSWSYFQVKRDKSCIISILIRIVRQTTCVHMSQCSQTASAGREC